MHKSLSLKREVLAPLTAHDMTRVVGASHQACGVTDACTELVTHGFTFDACPVPTLPIHDCPAITKLDAYSRVVCP